MEINVSLWYKELLRYSSKVWWYEREGVVKKFKMRGQGDVFMSLEREERTR